MDIPSSKKFALDRGEQLSKGVWSSFESILLDEVCFSLKQENDNTAIAKLYNDIVDYSTSSYSVVALPSNIVFRSKSLLEITSKINYTATHTLND